MKNFITYFYGIIPNKIRSTNSGYYIYSEGYEYKLKECLRTVEELYELYDLTSNIQCFHKIVINKYNNFLSEIGNKKYILMMIINNEDRKINIGDLEKMFEKRIENNYYYIVKNQWRLMWISKIDYIESNYLEYESKYNKYIDYNIGIAEMAIQLLQETCNEQLYICHNKINAETKVIDFYDPTNIVIDVKSRDFCEYYRNILDDGGGLDKVELSALNDNEKKLFFIRFLFNKNFFDLLEKKDEEKNLNFFNGIINHEDAIKKLYKANINILPDIEWLKKTG